MNRRLLAVIALLLLAFLAWRHFSPPPGDRHIILGEIEAMRQAAQNGNVSGILSRLDTKFRLQGASKSEIRSQLVAFYFTNNEVRLDLSGVDAKVNGDTATSDGAYTSRSRSGPGAPEDVKSGHFSAQWKKIEGQWKITQVSGVEGLSGS